jgi:phosphatidylglycerophosphatase A
LWHIEIIFHAHSSNYAGPETKVNKKDVHNLILDGLIGQWFFMKAPARP